MAWMQNRSRKTLDLRGPEQGKARRHRQFWVGAFVAVVIGCVIYDVFFHVHNVGPRTVVVNGENVEQVNGLRLRRTIWLKETDAIRFLSHIDVTKNPLSSDRLTYQGTLYIRAGDLVSRLNAFGDRAAFSQGVLSVALKSNQHYHYQAGGNVIRQKAVYINGQLSGRVLAVTHHEASLLPVGQISTQLSAAGVASSWDGIALHLQQSGKVTPLSIQDLSTSTLIAFGHENAMYAPNYSWNGETYLPINSLDAAFHQLGWSSSDDMWRWTFSSKKAAISGQHRPTVLAFVPFYYGDVAPLKDALKNPNVYNAVAADTWSVAPSGSLIGSAPVGTANEASASGDAAYAMVTNLGANNLSAKENASLFHDVGKSTRLRDDIVSGVVSDGFDGVTLDLESIPPAERSDYTDFVTSLASDLHSVGKRLQVVVPADTGYSSEPWNGAYDQTRLGQVADELIVMAYDYSYAGGPAGPIAPLPWVQQVLAYTVSRVPAEKVLLGVDAYGYDWSGKHTTAVGLTSVDKFLAEHHIVPKWDGAAEAPWYQWRDSHGKKHTVYYENAKSTAAKLALSRSYGIQGIALWRAGLEDKPVLDVLSSYANGKTNYGNH